MAPISQSIHLMGVHKIFDENGNMTEDSFDKAVESFFDQLIWWTKALKEAREKS